MRNIKLRRESKSNNESCYFFFFSRDGINSSNYLYEQFDGLMNLKSVNFPFNQ
jgi:hypothetical protein